MADTPVRVRHPLVELTHIRLLEFLRQPEAVFWTFGFPVLLTVALGIAFRSAGPELIPVAVEDTGPAAARAARALEKSPEIKVALLPRKEALLELRSGKVALVVRAAEQRDANGEDSPGDFVYRFDPTRPESRAARLAVDDALQRHRGRNDVVRAGDEKVTEPGSRYIDFLVPGLLGMNLMGSGMWGLGFSVVEARSKRLLKRLTATPMQRSHFLLSYMLSRLLGLGLEMVAIIGFAVLFFGVPLRGSLLDLALVTLLGALTFSGIGMLVAARPRTIEGVSGLMNFVQLPMWLLSGTFFSASRFPDFAQPFIKALPLTSLNDALRAIMNEGAGMGSQGLEMTILAAWCVTTFFAAVRIFRWQ